MCKDFNDWLALMLFLIIPTLWFLDGFKVISLNGEVLGATIMGWTMVLQFYYRKRKGES